VAIQRSIVAMPQVAFACPACHQPLRTDLVPEAASVTCPGCGDPVPVAAPTYAAGRLDRCVVCPSRELFVRKDFPQRLGVAIVVAGFAASCWTWARHQIVATFAILMATALVDVVLYLLMGNVLECYRCHAQYRGVSGLENHDAFDLEVHERHRQEKIRAQRVRSE
jgi:hypothetical protein